MNNADEAFNCSCIQRYEIPGNLSFALAPEHEFVPGGRLQELVHVAGARAGRWFL